MRRHAYLYILMTIVVSESGAKVCRGQDTGKIIEQYAKAVGGGKALSKLQTLSIDGTFSEGGDGKPGTYSLRTKQPNRYYSEIRSEGKTQIESYNGKSAWHETDSGETSTLLGEQALEMEAAGQYFNSGLRNLGKKKIGVAFKGYAQVHGRDALQVELTFPTGVQWEVFFDSQSHLIVEEKATIAGIAQEIYYEDYRSVSGIKVPYKFELHRGSETYSVSVTQASVNETVGERVFDFPRKSQVQLPDLKKLFTEIDENQKTIDKIKENYAGTREEEQTEYDKSGKVTKKEVKEFTFFYLDGEEISTLVKKDGKALSEDEQKKENEKTQKRIEEIQKKDKKKQEEEQKAKEAGKEAKNEEPGIEIFLRVCQFVNPRRERFRGQDVLVFDFEPNPEHKPKNFEEKVVRELAGVVWVDEKADAVARLEASFLGDVHIGGGVLANLQKGTSFVLEQGYINNEVWLPTYGEVHLGIRVLLVKGFKVNAVAKYSDYKRFNVETLNRVNKPKETVEAPAKP